jgi:hypothetical protein
LANKAENSAQDKLLQQANWNGPRPWLRFYLCICHDDACQALLNKDACIPRDELDARGNNKRPCTFEEVVADLYNDEDYIPVTESIPDLHSMFAKPMALKLSMMPGGRILSNVVKGKLNEVRAKLLQVSYVIGFSFFAFIDGN